MTSTATATPGGLWLDERASATARCAPRDGAGQRAQRTRWGSGRSTLGLVHLAGIAALVGLASSTALAETLPTITVSGSSTCPTPEAVAHEVASFTRAPASGAASYHLEIETTAHDAHVARLLDPAGKTAFVREVESDDCASVAAAFGIILRAHFLDLGFVLPSAPDTASPSPVQEATRVEAPPPSPSAAPPSGGEPAPVPSAPVAETPTPAPSPSRAHRWLGTARGAVSGQVEVPAPRAAGSGLLGLGLARGPLRLLLDGELFIPRRSGEVPDRIATTTAGALLSAGWRSGGRVWFQPRLGFGARFGWVEAIDAPAGAPVGTASPVVELGIAWGVGQQRLTPWLEGFATLLLDRDRYLIEPRGEVGLGPRAALGLRVGLALEPSPAKEPRGSAARRPN